MKNEGWKLLKTEVLTSPYLPGAIYVGFPWNKTSGDACRLLGIGFFKQGRM
jgi:hypothetical protein